MLEIGTQILYSAFGLIVIFGMVVVIHELGHYWAGRLSNAKIESFSVGFGKPILERKDKHGTRWRINALPFGGFVAFVSRGQAQKDAHLEGLKGLAYEDIGPWKRNFISVAGPAANFILAIFLFAGLSLWTGQTTASVMIGDVNEGEPAHMAGLQYGDHVVAIDGKKLKHPNELIRAVSLSADDPLTFELLRAGSPLTLSVTPQRKAQTTAIGQEVEMGFIGVEVGVQNMKTENINPLKALAIGVEETKNTIDLTVNVIGRIITGKESVHMMTGPIGIGDATRRVFQTANDAETASGGQRVSWTILTLVQLCALISIGIGFFNILPFPILDGGHVVINTYEAITGTMMPEIIQDYAMRFGVICLVGMFIYISIGDLQEVGLFG